MGNGPWHCLVIRTDVAKTSLEWLERGSLGLFAGGLSCGMPEAARFGGHEGKAWACAGMGSCSRNLILKIGLCCFLCVGNVTCRLARMCRFSGIAKACGDARKNVIFHPFLGTCPMLT